MAELYSGKRLYDLITDTLDKRQVDLLEGYIVVKLKEALEKERENFEMGTMRVTEVLILYKEIEKTRKSIINAIKIAFIPLYVFALIVLCKFFLQLLHFWPFAV